MNTHESFPSDRKVGRWGRTLKRFFLFIALRGLTKKHFNKIANRRHFSLGVLGRKEISQIQPISRIRDIWRLISNYKRCHSP